MRAHMNKHWIKVVQPVLVGLASTTVALVGAPQPKALAQTCNVFGCSPSSVAQCNPFGCPTGPGAGECTPFGCPPAPSGSSSNNSNSRTFTIRNNSNSNITELYLSSSSDSSWGANDINSTLFSGNSVSYTLTGGCSWDLRVVTSSGSEFTEEQIDTCLNSTYTLGSASPATSSKPAASSNNSMGECLDRVMWLTIQSSGETYSGSSTYRFNKPSGVTDSAMQAAGLTNSFTYGWTGPQSFATVQAMSAQEAAAICR